MPNKILCAVDGSDHSNVAIVEAAKLAAQCGATLSICCVNVLFRQSLAIGYVTFWKPEEVDRILADAVARTAEQGIAVAETKSIKDRDVATAIIRCAEATGADHIAIGTGDKRGVSRLILGSVAADVAARAPCSVTIFR